MAAAGSGRTGRARADQTGRERHLRFARRAGTHAGIYRIADRMVVDSGPRRHPAIRPGSDEVGDRCCCPGRSVAFDWPVVGGLCDLAGESVG